jgi:LPXTG-site transpeptidase (sortase) family protein
MTLIDGLGHDIDRVQKPKQLKAPNPVLGFGLDIALVALFSALIFVAVNAPAYYMIVMFKVLPEKFAKNIEVPVSPISPKDVAQLPDDSIVISKIGVEAPIIWDAKDPDIMRALEGGVAHLAGSGKPKEGKNIFLTGHSSNYWWSAGNYKTIFALLPELKEKDEILLTRDGAISLYEVEKTIEVKKSEVGGYLNTDSERLTIMTCVPVGTNLRRLLVIAKPIL